MKGKTRGRFSGKLGFVLSSAGAAVGLGNIWRFPYLAAKHGGGIFLLVYIFLTVTFGFTMVVSETVIGRATEKSPVGAFKCFSDSRMMHARGWLNAIIPILIVPYYSVIGGWVIKYCYEFITNDLSVVATDEFFGEFIADGAVAEACFIIFSLRPSGSYSWAFPEG